MDGFNSNWTKALVVAGGAAATAGLLWYLLREGDEEEGKVHVPEGGPMMYCVTDAKGAAVGIRTEPDVNSERTGLSLLCGQMFQVSELLPAEDGQTYLKLADGRGWAFTHSARDGRLLCSPVSPEEAARYAEQGPGMGDFMADLQRILASNPEAMKDPQLMRMMQDPETLRQMAMHSPLVGDALRQQPLVGEALASDPAAFADSLRGTAEAK
eukprot:TRINITY_DN59561_c0_g1_i1.p1 TRINITY_DN59561_c0_g1~~TRINITY_DN59561_c0_g1_i1.p1  ORF type:complete len:212 (+),score=48.85 TRINITY_DN59561_c0_g1_i1:98-733(+)